MRRGTLFFSLPPGRGHVLLRWGLEDSRDDKLAEGWAMLDRNFQKITTVVREFLSFAKDRVPVVRPADPNRDEKNSVPFSSLSAPELLEGMKNAITYARGQPVPGARETVVEVPTVDVRAIRKRLDLSQKSFAATFGFTLASVRNWEQGTRRPERAARILLELIDRHPDTVRQTIEELSQAVDVDAA